MAIVGDNYILPGKSDHDRLTMISEVHDGATRELLRLAALTQGCRFVEFGCGIGSVTRWAAARGAHATGTDANEEQIEACRALADADGLASVEFRTGNVYEPHLDPDTVDMVYCRWLMVHLKSPVDAMRAIHKALKPGGVMVCEEAAVGAVYTEPRSAAYEEMRILALNAGRARGVDYDGGERVHLWAKQAGFELVHVAAYHPHYLSGPHKRLWSWTFSNATRRLVEEGSLSLNRWQELVAGMRAADDSPDTVVAHCRMHQLIARKPVC